MKLRSLAVSAGVLAALSWAAPAYATSYGSSSSPIRIGSDGNGWFYGSVTIHNRSSIRNSYYYRDTRADGNAVYVESRWYFREVDEGSVSYPYSGKDQSSRIGTNDGTVHEADSHSLISTSDAARAITKVCEDQSWSPDPCSSSVTVTLRY